jgi:hypothetical protein
MKAITLRQPWAGAMALGFKTIETRGRRFSYRGDLCIHSSGTFYDDDIPDELRYLMREQLCNVFGAILAVVDVFDCIHTEVINRAVEAGAHISEGDRMLGDYSPGRYGILTRNLRVLFEPVPCRGAQAMPWTVQPPIEYLVTGELQK